SLPSWFLSNAAKSLSTNPSNRLPTDFLSSSRLIMPSRLTSHLRMKASTSNFQAWVGRRVVKTGSFSACRAAGRITAKKNTKLSAISSPMRKRRIVCPPATETQLTPDALKEKVSVSRCGCRITRRIEELSRVGEFIRVVVYTDNPHVARAASRATVEQYPKVRIRLRNRALVMEEHRPK